MQQDLAERRVKALQKALLLRLEDHPIFYELDPERFNAIRKRVFRSTFDAYRLGVVGVETSPRSLYVTFFGWMDGVDTYWTTSACLELRDLCFRAALEAFRLGAMVAGHRHDES